MVLHGNHDAIPSELTKERKQEFVTTVQCFCTTKEIAKEQGRKKSANGNIRIAPISNSGNDHIQIKTSIPTINIEVQFDGIGRLYIILLTYKYLIFYNRTCQNYQKVDGYIIVKIALPSHLE